MKHCIKNVWKWIKNTVGLEIIVFYLHLKILSIRNEWYLLYIINIGFNCDQYATK